MSTNRLSAKDIKREWHLIDAKNQILGRLSTQIAQVLMGKDKPFYVPYLEMGDNVVVINAAKILISGKKTQQKKYYHHSGYPGGFKVENLAQLLVRKPEEVILRAVKGMLPKNKLGQKMIKRLHLFSGPTHSFEKQLKGAIDARQ